MLFEHISYVPFAHLRFTEEELRVAVQCSVNHYDFKCKSMAREPASDETSDATVGLLLKIARHHLRLETGYKLTWGQIDTLCKVMEASQYLRVENDQQIGFGLLLACRRTLTRLNEAAVPNIGIGGEA